MYEEKLNEKNQNNYLMMKMKNYYICRILCI